LSGKVSLAHKNTLYSRFGNWFGIVDFIGAMFFIFIIIINRKKHITSPNKSKSKGRDKISHLQY
jgi:apolipoprotein N-acyltransferase